MTATILIGDALDVLKTIPERSVHCCVTSPPYYGLRDYKVPPTTWGDGWVGCLGLEPTPEMYVDHLVEVFREVKRVLRDDGTLWLNLGDSYNNRTRVRRSSHQPALHGVVDRSWRERAAEGGCRMSIETGDLKEKDLIGVPWMAAFALRADGWHLRSDIIWAKPNPMPESVTDRPTRAHEYVFLLAKKSRYFYDAVAAAESAVSTHPSGNGFKRDARLSYRDENGARGNDRQWQVTKTRNRRSVWSIATHPFPEAHFATFPPALVEPCVKAGTSERGVCPACGAGWVRVMERTSMPIVSAKGSRFDRGKTAARDGGDRTQSGDRFLLQAVGWRPSCACPPHEPIPATVLDPFAGSGTVGEVCHRLGRHSLLIDLNPEYEPMMLRRLAKAGYVRETEVVAALATEVGS